MGVGNVDGAKLDCIVRTTIQHDHPALLRTLYKV